MVPTRVTQRLTQYVGLSVFWERVQPYLLGQAEAGEMLPLHVCSDGPQVPVQVVYQSQLAAGVQLLQHRDKTGLSTANNNVPFSDSHPIILFN